MYPQEEDWAQPFFVGHHSTSRTLPVTGEDIDQANACNYDMLTTPITNSHFCSRVLQLVSQYRAESKNDELPCPTIPPLTHLDTPLTPGDITSQLLGFTSTWIDICSPDPLVSGLSKQVLALEIAYAAFCGLEYVFVSGPRLYHGDCATHGVLQYARAIQDALAIASHMQISIVVPMIDRADVKEEYPSTDLAAFTKDEYLDDFEEDRPKDVDLFGMWDAWNLIRSMCKYNTRLSSTLEIPQHFPAISAIQSRWFSEPVKAIVLHSKTFVANNHGNAALPTATRSFINRLMRVKGGPWILLEDVDPIPLAEEMDIGDDGSFQWMTKSSSKDPTPAEQKQQQKESASRGYPFAHLDYIRWIQKQQPPRTAVERYGAGYQDYLQVPLQPLTDNLESMTYEVFEKDPVKYDLYEEAIRRALRDWKANKKATSGPDGKVVVAVAGAGRGPLVTRALRASEAEQVSIEMWAVEKNPNAYVLLQRHNQTTWNGRVTIVKSDMRSWKGPWRADKTYLQSSNVEAEGTSNVESNSPPVSIPQPGHGPIDILISELLGSFADNELSPECLDGILHLLSPQGISIPQSYTAFLTPIAAPKLHADIMGRSMWDSTAPETPSVVWLHAIDYLSLTSVVSKEKKAVPNQNENSINDDQNPGSNTASPTKGNNDPDEPNVLPVWSFFHTPMKEQPPSPVSNTHNQRFARLNFRIRDRGVCHGFGGYFESVLYPGVELSTNPNTMEAKSDSMISWFPIFFPLKVPIYVPDNSEISVSLWRQTDDRKVWYEWMVEYWALNVRSGGSKRLARLGASELHSSIKNGCLM